MEFLNSETVRELWNKTKTALTDKQDRISGSRGQMVGFDENGQLTAIQQPALPELEVKSNQNLLINWDFRKPVNRNGAVKYTKSNTIGIDRWMILRGALEIKEGYVAITPTSADDMNFYQELEFPQDYCERMLTVSVLMDVPATMEGSLCWGRNGPDMVKISSFSGSGLNIYQASFSLDSTLELIGLSVPYTKTTACIKLYAIKLEFGTEQTLARQNENAEWELIDPPNYTLQYSLCNQYNTRTGAWVGDRRSNPNLLLNSYWHEPQKIINQKSKKEYAEVGYTVDRWNTWKLRGEQIGTLKLEENDIVLASRENESANIVLEYKFEAPIKARSTVSLFVKAITGILAFETPLGAITITEPGVYWISTSDSSTWIRNYIRIYGRQSDEVFRATLCAAKLELGEEQTLARQNESGEWELIDPPPERGLELLKCQRYQVVYGGEGGMPLLAPGYSTGAVTAVFLLDLPTAMRATPAVSFSNLYVNLSGTRIPVTGAAVLGAPAQNKLAMQVTCSGANFGAGEPCFLEGQGDYRLLLDANL